MIRLKKAKKVFSYASERDDAIATEVIVLIVVYILIKENLSEITFALPYRLLSLRMRRVISVNIKAMCR